MVARVVERTPALMVLGTASNAGKSLVVTALCRLLRDRGLRVAPFKAQNMSLEAAATLEGGEIGRAQALQAEAAGLLPHVDMNPILLKPGGETRSQVIVEGQVLGDIGAWEYHERRTHELFPRVVAAYERLAARSDVVVLEGAGSPAEINLRAGDIVNMRMAHAADAACILVADIDRGGAFAALAGTLALLDDADRTRIRGFVINKFRGDRALLEPGLRMIEERVGLPCLGVIPWLADHGLEEEDGYGMRRGPQRWPPDDGPRRELRVAVVVYPHAANRSDADALAHEPSLCVREVVDPSALGEADVAILPGSKQTRADLAWLHDSGIADAVIAHAKRGGIVIGMCGGMQMLGRAIDDPDGIEAAVAVAPLALLDLTTTLAAEKIVTPRRAHIAAPPLDAPALAGMTVAGYEIHCGRSRVNEAPLLRLDDLGADGAVSSGGRVIGTYLHGLFDDDAFRHAFVAAARAHAGLAPSAAWNHHRAERDARLDRWAAHVRNSIDLEAVLALAGVAQEERNDAPATHQEVL